MLSFRASLNRLQKPSDVCDGLLAHLNIHMESDVPLSSIVPHDQLQDRPFLYDTDLESMLAELDTPNEDAYREVLRMPPLEGHTKPRLAYSRNFFASLEDMRRYYDASEDNYYEVEMDEQEKEDLRRTWEKNAPQSNEDPKPDEDGDSNMTNNKPTADPESEPTTSTTLSSNNPNMKRVYKGLRLGNATSLPPQTRTACVRNLLKMASHKFSCRDYDPSPRERLRIVDVNLPPQPSVPTFVVVKTPSETKMARGRYVEGPVLGVCVRSDAVFTREGKMNAMMVTRREPEGDVHGAAFDFGREMACMLCVAMQRNREGRESKEVNMQRESERWWVKEKRWGGGEVKWGMLPFEVYEDEDPSWSSEERELQVKKRREAEEEMKKMPEAIGGAGGRELNVDDLMAGKKEGVSEKTAMSPAKAMADIDASDSGRSERGPPKKKNRVDIPTRSNPQPSDTANPESGHDENTSRSHAKGTLRVSSRKKKEDKEQFHEGRRVMYVPPMKKRWYKDWQELKPNASTWDDKMIYKRVGKASQSEDEGVRGGDGSREEEWDEVYQVSSINHHVAIMKMRISKRYLQWLETGDVEKRDDGREDDCLKVWRTKWFDMFDVEARKEFLIGLWRIMSWLCRHEVLPAEWEKMQAMKRETGAKESK